MPLHDHFRASYNQRRRKVCEHQDYPRENVALQLRKRLSRGYTFAPVHSAVKTQRNARRHEVAEKIRHAKEAKIVHFERKQRHHRKSVRQPLRDYDYCVLVYAVRDLERVRIVRMNVFRHYSDRNERHYVPRFALGEYERNRNRDRRQRHREKE